MELDVGFESNTIGELTQKFYILPETFIESIRESDEFIVNKINAENIINIEPNKKKHKTMFKKDVRLERVEKKAMISILAKNSAYHYSNIMNFSLTNLKNYFDARVVKIREYYNSKDLSEVKSICFLYEKHNSIVSRNISIKTFSDKQILFGGYAVRSLISLYANADEIIFTM